MVSSDRRSAVARLDAEGRLLSLDLVGSDEEVLAALPPAPAVVVVDAPLAMPGNGGQRDVERVLAWCDIPLFPVSASRLRQVFGRHAGRRPERTHVEPLAAGACVESAPDAVLHQLAWERARPATAAPLDLGASGPRGCRCACRGTGRAAADARAWPASPRPTSS